jgi:hypothetical protein
MVTAAAPSTPQGDADWRQHGPVKQVQTTPAFQLLRQVHGWTTTLAPDWRPTPADAQLLEEAVSLIRGVAARLASPARAC